MHAVGASVVPKRRRPPRPCVGGPGGPKAKEAPSPMQWGPRWSQSEGGPHAHTTGTSVVPKRKRPGFAECPSYPTVGGGEAGWVGLAEFQAGWVSQPPPPRVGCCICIPGRACVERFVDLLAAPRVGRDFVGALGSIEPVPLLSFFCCRFRVTCLFMVCLHVIAHHVCMPHAHKGARMLCRLC